MAMPPGPYRTSPATEPVQKRLTSKFMDSGSRLLWLSAVRHKGWLGRLLCLHANWIWIPYYGTEGPPPMPFSRSWQCVDCGKVINLAYHDSPVGVVFEELD